jgi:NinG protein
MRMHNSSIRVNKKQLKCGHFDYNFSRGRCKQCALIEDINKKDSLEVFTIDDLRCLIEDADILVSRFVRLSATNRDGDVKCFTCPSVKSWKEMDAGHYIPRANMYLRYDLRNLRPQCHVCNRVKYGQPALFAQHLEKDFPGLPDILLEESRMIHHISREELRAIISEYTDKINELKK